MVGGKRLLSGGGRGLRALAFALLASSACSGGEKAAKDKPAVSGDESGGAVKPKNATPAPATPIGSIEAAKAAVGRRVTLRGTSANAKLGRVVMLEGSPVYCGADDEWPAGDLDKTVTVSGTLELRESPAPPDGEISAGISGEYLFLLECALE